MKATKHVKINFLRLKLILFEGTSIKIYRREFLANMFNWLLL